MRLSVVVPVLNGMPFIVKTVTSLKMISKSLEMEVIFQDAMSSDGTSEYLAKICKECVYWKHVPEKDEGQSDAINRGVTRAAGEWVTWLCADDVLLPDFVKCVDEGNRSGSDVVYGDVILTIGNQITPAVGTERYEPGKLCKSRLFIQQPGTCIRRTYWNKMGGLNGSLNWTMDYDLFMRLDSAGAHFHRTESFVASILVHPDAKTSTGSYKRPFEIFRVLWKNQILNAEGKAIKPYFVYGFEFIIKFIESKPWAHTGMRWLIPILHNMFWKLIQPKEEGAIKERFVRQMAFLEKYAMLGKFAP